VRRLDICGIGYVYPKEFKDDRGSFMDEELE